MAEHLNSYKFLSFLSNFKNASILNAKGELIFSKDADPFKTTTSRIVLFQIAKKYLSPKVGDIIISNDPENGGTQLNRVFFVSCLHNNLFVVWDAEFNEINFKIPLMPLIEQHKKNSMIWGALIEAQPKASSFKNFFEDQFDKLQQTQVFQKFITVIASEIFQKTWFTSTRSIFEDHFSLKSFGSCQLALQYRGKAIKMAVTADEKQGIKSFTLDLSGTALADQFSASSHVVESGLVIEISKFYNLERCLSQPVLNQIKLLLPPKSVVSKSIPTGEYNFELQKLTRQMTRYCLGQLNTQTKKNDKRFSMYSTAYLSLHSDQHESSSYLSNSRIDFQALPLFEKKSFSHKDKDYSGCLLYNSELASVLHLYGIQSGEDANQRWIKLNGESIHHGKFQLKKGDELSFQWRL